MPNPHIRQLATSENVFIPISEDFFREFTCQGLTIEILAKHNNHLRLAQDEPKITIEEREEDDE